jgi:hypothetical protein
MLGVRDRLLDELDTWVEAIGIDAGPAFLRLHVIDMEGPMDIEVGVMTPSGLSLKYCARVSETSAASGKEKSTVEAGSLRRAFVPACGRRGPERRHKYL